MMNRAASKVSEGFFSGMGGLAARVKAFARGAGAVGVRSRRPVMEGLEGRQLMTLAPTGLPVALAEAGLNPAVTVAGDGSFNVAWTGFDSDFSGVYVQRFDAAGKALDKSPVLANTTSKLQQFDADIARSGDGTFMVVWTTVSEVAGEAFDVRAQLFKADGSKSGGEIVVNSAALGSQSQASVAALPSTSSAGSNGFVVTWLNVDAEGQSVQGQIYSHAGAAVGDEFKIDTTVAEDETVGSPKVGAADNGSFVVTWQRHVETGSTMGIYGQRFGSDGGRAGSEFLAASGVVSYAQGAATFPSYDMAVAGDGYIVVAYDTYNFEGLNWDVNAQVITNENTSDFGVFTVNSTVAGDQYHPSATFKADGTILMTWEGSAAVIDSKGGVVVARRFVGTGIGGPEILISSKGDGFTQGLYPQIGGHSDAGFTVVWQGFDDATGQNPKVWARVVEDVVTGPSAVVTGNGLVISNGSTVAGANDGTAFGTVNLGGQEVMHTFRVANNGTQTLVTSNLKVPTGFRIVEGLSQTITAGGFDEFTVALETAEAKSRNGQVSFGVNMGNTTSYAFSVSGQVQASPGDGVYIITKNSPKADRTFIDQNNNRVVFTVTGNGAAKLTTDPTTHAFLSIEMTGTDAKSGLDISVSAKGSTTGRNGTATGNGTGAGSVGMISVAGGLLKLTAKEMALTGDFTAGGAIKTIVLGNVGSGDQHDFKLGGASKDKTDLNLGTVKDITFTSTATVDTLKVVRWENNVGGIDVITAPAIGTLKVTGIKQTAKVAGMEGDFEASLSLSGGGITKPTVKTLGALEIAGDLAGGEGDFVNVAGYVGSIVVGGDVTSAHIMLSAINGVAKSEGKLGSLSVGGVVTFATLEASGAVGALKVSQWDEGWIKALSLASITTTGKVGTVDVRGRFGAEVTVNPGKAAVKGNALGAVTIQGVLLETMLTVNGNVGAISVGGVNGSAIAVTGKIASFTSSGQVLGSSTLKAGGVVGAIKAINWLGGEIAALSVASVTISGVYKVGGVAVANDYTGELTLGNVGGVSSGAITVAGSLNSNFWSTQGSVGPLTVGSAHDMNINIGGGMGYFQSKGAVVDVELKAAGATGSITSASWKGGSIQAAKILNIGTSGIKGSATVTADPGNFSANVSTTGEGFIKTGAAKPTLIGAINIAGQLGKEGDSSVTIVSQGKIGAITTGSLVDVSINAVDDITSLTNKGTAAGVRLTAGQKMGAVSSINWLDGEMTAQQFGSITIKGRKATLDKPGVEGDFTGTVTAVGVPGVRVKTTLGAVNIAGSLGLTGGAMTEFKVNGSMGQMTAGAIAGSKVTVSGNWSGLTVKGMADGLDAVVGIEGEQGAFTAGTMGAVTAARIVDSKIHSGKMTSLKVTGRKASAANGPEIAGDAMGLTLTVEDASVKAGTVMLAALTVEGNLSNSVVRVSDSTGAVSVGQINHSTVFVGVSATFEAGGLPVSATSFSQPRAKLAGFTVTGAGAASGAASFVSSVVAAGELVNVSLKLVAAPEGEAETGFAAAFRIGAYKRLVSAGSTQTLKVMKQTAPGTYDAPDGTTYVLKITTRPPGMYM